jgi:exopolyphosphatase/guanosine-5'-triphosphate,3'-diphosphate pyrophosphatase
MTRHPFGPVGIIDIGSNSVRFVVYGGSQRVPSLLFNEKVMAALGRGLARDGRLDEPSIALTIEALARFKILGREMKLQKLHAVATAAVRDAANGADFLARARAVGITPTVIPGEEEARLAALGVISAIPKAHGIVADLGGGSLELVPVANGTPGPGISLPLGVLRLGDKASARALTRIIGGALEAHPELAQAALGHRALYLVGGSFRALGLLDLRLSKAALPIIHAQRMSRERINEMRALVRTTPADQLRAMADVSTSRLQTLPAAAAVLDALGRVLDPGAIVISSFGLREGILFNDLAPAVRAHDPLLAAALEVGERLGRFGDHGALLDRWIAPVFADDAPEPARIRLAACLLADVAWNAHPDFRAEWAVDMGVHGNWVGIDGHGRALLGRALCSAFGGNGCFTAGLEALLTPDESQRAQHWGRAIRLAQRLSGGTAALLGDTRLRRDGGRIVLALPKGRQALFSDAVKKRFRQLAAAMGCEAVVEAG